MDAPLPSKKLHLEPVELDDGNFEPNPRGVPRFLEASVFDQVSRCDADQILSAHSSTK